MKQNELLELIATIAGAEAAYLFDDKSVVTIKEIDFQKSSFMVYTILRDKCFKSKDEDITVAEFLKRIKKSSTIAHEEDIDSVILPKDLFNENKN